MPAVKERKDICETSVLSVVLYRCEAWSFILMEEQRMRVFENGVPKGPKREEVTGGWMKIGRGAS
jgi:hypothetical protein